MDAYSFISKHWGMIATILFLWSELLAEVPAIRANSIFSLIRDLFKGEAKKAQHEIVEAITKAEEAK